MCVQSEAIITGYTFVWDVEIVLDYLKVNITDNSQFSCQDLTDKIVVLMALSSGSTASSIKILREE